ncbi:MAG: ATP-binding protein, partial [Rectinemataceae bacterium]
KPIPSYQVYRGTVFELFDQAVDFVMSKIDRRVGTRALGPQAPVEYELPREAVAEAIVNAVAHRDYTSNASVQVMLFADRLEVWNPGELPPPLTIDQLSLPHASIPRNPLIAEPLFLAHYAEKAGSGILDMIALCQHAGLPRPEFRQEGGQFIQAIWRPKRVEEPLIEAHDEAHEAHDEAHDPISLPEQLILSACLEGPRSAPELLNMLGYVSRTGNFKRSLKKLIGADLLQMSIPDSPRSKKQKYRLTDKGRSWLAANSGKGIQP